jgi:hypothetical protein
MSINIPMTVFRTFEPAVQAALKDYVLRQLGTVDLAQNESGSSLEGDEKGLAKLDVSEAKFFLNKCSEKTIRILREIVKRQGHFRVSSLAELFDTTPRELRGVWAGLTKRVRTVKKDPHANLLNWFKQGNDDWNGEMASQTVEALKKALDQRG